MSLDDYELHEEIGRGGMAIVFLATRKKDGAKVAIKQVRPGRSVKSQWNETLLRFQNEAEILEKLNAHENILTIIDMDPSFIATELLTGGTLADAAPHYVGKYNEAAEIVLAAANSVALAHDVGIIHRDLSIRNIMFRTPPPSPKNLVVTDFGLAVHWQDTLRLTETGDFLGTLDFASHEQLQDSKHVAEPTDVFSLGVILFKLCSGTFPFRKAPRNTPEQALKNREKAKELSQTCADFGLPACPLELANICSRCLVSIENGRINSMKNLCNDLKNFLCIV